MLKKDNYQIIIIKKMKKSWKDQTSSSWVQKGTNYDRIHRSVKYKSNDIVKRLSERSEKITLHR